MPRRPRRTKGWGSLNLGSVKRSNPRKVSIKRDMWITGKVRVTKSGKIQVKVPPSAVNPFGFGGGGPEEFEVYTDSGVLTPMTVTKSRAKQIAKQARKSGETGVVVVRTYRDGKPLSRAVRV